MSMKNDNVFEGWVYILRNDFKLRKMKSPAKDPKTVDRTLALVTKEKKDPITYWHT